MTGNKGNYRVSSKEHGQKLINPAFNQIYKYIDEIRNLGTQMKTWGFFGTFLEIWGLLGDSWVCQGHQKLPKFFWGNLAHLIATGRHGASGIPGLKGSVKKDSMDRD